MEIFTEAFWLEWDFELCLLGEALPALAIYALLFTLKKMNDGKKAIHKKFWGKDTFSDN